MMYKPKTMPYDMFISKVDKEKYPYIQQIYRFQEVL